MKRVTIVDLGGQAYHMEDAAAKAVDDWLAVARTALAADPDAAEILSDFERAIADRFSRVAPGLRDVVSEADARAALDALGPVEVSAESVSGEPEAATANGASGANASNVSSAAETDSKPWRERKLYRLPGEPNAMTGVCAGIAAYLRIDVTVVRVITVLLTLATGGGLFVGYIVLALVIPEATTDSEKAAVRGYGDTAQDLITQVRDNAGPALSSVGNTLSQIFVGVGHVVRWLGIAATWVALALWIALIAIVSLFPDSWSGVFDQGTSAWLVALFVTCLSWLAVAFSLGVVKFGAAMSGAAKPGAAGPDAEVAQARSRPASVFLHAGWGVATIGALVGAVLIPLASSSDLKGLSDGQGRIEIFDTTLCFERGNPDYVALDEADAPAPTLEERCRPGDERISMD